MGVLLHKSENEKDNVSKCDDHALFAVAEHLISTYRCVHLGNPCLQQSCLGILRHLQILVPVYKWCLNHLPSNSQTNVVPENHVQGCKSGRSSTHSRLYILFLSFHKILVLMFQSPYPMLS